MLNKFRLTVITLGVLILSAGCGPSADQMVTPSPTALQTSETVSEQVATATPQASPQPTITVPTETEPGSQVISTPAPDSIPQNTTWIKTYGNGHESLGGGIIQTNDGGLLIVGGIGTIQGNTVQGGVLLLKTDASGEVLWQKVYGGEEFDIGWSIVQTRDGNYLLAGETTSFGAGGMDIYLIKVDQDGNEIWSKTYGSSMDEAVSSVGQTQDGGYLLVGNSVDPNDVITDPGTAGYAGFAGRSNIHVVKTDKDGNEAWSRTYESEDNVIASSGAVTPDGGCVILATIIYYPGFDNDLYLLKIDGEGNEIWARTWEEDALAGYAMIQTSDNNFLITGTYEISENSLSDSYLLKVDAQGNEIWMYTFGDPGLFESGQALIETSDGKYMILGSATKSLYTGETDIQLVFIDKAGELIWMKSVKSYLLAKANAILQLADGGYVITGSISTSGHTFKAILIKTDADGNVRE